VNAIVTVDHRSVMGNQKAKERAKANTAKEAKRKTAKEAKRKEARKKEARKKGTTISTQAKVHKAIIKAVE